MNRASCAVFDELNNVRDMAEIDSGLFTPIKRVLFGTDADPRTEPAADR